ncbi:MAG: DUF1232 domain-containing protein [Methanotrichaceae archaeon]|nr:DUF1232 domain-containing protein [Methanotrichaceae archaeon]
MKRFDKLLEDDISGYEGKFSDLIREAPAFFRLMTRLLDDPLLPEKLSQLVIAAMAYFIKPLDIIPEENLGPQGYVDDIFLCAFVAEKVMVEAASEDILINNWDGKRSVIPLIKEILKSEKELIGDNKVNIMDFIGYEELASA